MKKFLIDVVKCMGVIIGVLLLFISIIELSALIMCFSPWLFVLWMIFVMSVITVAVKRICDKQE